MRPLYDCIKEEKSEADKMFEELGFEKVKDNNQEVQYDYDKTIMGERLRHTILIAKIGKIIFSYNADKKHSMAFGIKELQAINKKVEELGWNK